MPKDKVKSKPQAQRAAMGGPMAMLGAAMLGLPAQVRLARESSNHARPPSSQRRERSDDRQTKLVEV